MSAPASMRTVSAAFARVRTLLAPDAGPTGGAHALRTGVVLVRRAPLQRLLWVLAAFALATAPHLPHLPIWIVLLAAAAAAWRIAAEVNQWPLPPKWLRVVVAMMGLLAVLAIYRTVNGVEAGTALLVVMGGMKLLETRTVRDLTVIVFLAYFALFAAFLYDQSLIKLPYLLAATWLNTVTLMRIHESTSTLRASEAARLTGKMLLQALPLAALLFLFFPRLPGQFWAIAARSEARTGIDEEISPGDVSELSVSDAIAFRVKFAGTPPPPRERYWRGPVMHEFDGRTWRRGNAWFTPQTLRPVGPTYEYSMMLEPHHRHWIFALDAVTEWPVTQARRMPDFQLLTGLYRPITTLTSFDLKSATQYRVTGPLPRAMRAADLRLPPDRNPRAVELAKRMRAEAGDDAAFIEAVLRMFREEAYYYTLEPPRLELHAVDDFLFNTRRGFCEHFASAFTLMARAAGVPARVVAGYHGGEFNPMSGHIVVRQSDAHAWSEVWLEDRGWVRVDPTAAVAPERIESGGLIAALPRDETATARLLRNNPLFTQVRLAWDAANTFWNTQVIQFGQAQQRWLLERFALDGAHWKHLGFALVASIAVFFAALSGYLAWRFRPKRKDPVAEIYDALCRRLAARRMPRLPHEGPVDYLARVSRMRPDLANALAEIRQVYVGLRYGPSPLSSELSRLKHLVNQLPLR
jgi:transglutaminase-like putative cysteine protease